MRVIGARDRAVAHLYTRKSSSLRRSGKGTAYCGATAFVGFTHPPECCGGRRGGVSAGSRVAKGTISGEVLRNDEIAPQTRRRPSSS